MIKKIFLLAVLLVIGNWAAGLEIIEAKVGLGDKYLDATEAFKKAKITDDVYIGWFQGATMAGSDPVPGKVKEIIVKYKDNDGSEQTRVLAEKSFAAIAAGTPGPTREFTLGRAFWGDKGKFVEVTDALRNIIADKKEITLRSGDLDVTADPLPGKEKYLIVIYSVGGKQYVDSFKERSKFKGSSIDGSFDPIAGAQSAKSPFQDMTLDQSVWQWSVKIPGSVSYETQEPSTAFLYIPPKTEKLRGVVIGEYNMLERPIMEHPIFREYLQKLDYGCIWIAPSFFAGKPWNGNFDFRNPDHARPLDAMFAELAKVSGHAELNDIAFVGLGHSAMADFPYQLAAWKPERAIAGISYDGTSPGVAHSREYGTNPILNEEALTRIEGIPFLQRYGDYNESNDRPLIARKYHPAIPLTSLADPGSTHFDINDQVIDYIGRYLVKTDQARGVGKGPLKKVDVKQGWLIDYYRPDQAPLTSPAPFAQFKAAKTGAWGDENNWVFDEEHAQFHQQHEARYRGLKRQELGYMQNGEILPRTGDHFQVHPKFIPNRDGLSFPLKGAFLDSITKKGDSAPTALTHGSDPQNIKIYPSCGPAVRIDDDTVAVRFDRFGFNASGRANSFSFNAIHPGDSVYRRSVIQSSMSVPKQNTAGIRQYIVFPEPKDVKAGTASVTLDAKCNTGMPVEYLVVHGPAYLKNNQLILTEIPPGSKFPVEVKVTAWQYGSSNEPKLQTASPVTRTFNIVK